MKTTLPDKILNEGQAIAFLTALHDNNEAFHPQDDANDVIWNTCKPTRKERDKLNDLMEQCYKLPGFCPCGVLVDLLIRDGILPNDSE